MCFGGLCGFFALWWPVWPVLHCVCFGGLCGLFCTVCALVACAACFALCVLWWPVWPVLHCVCFGGLCGLFCTVCALVACVASLHCVCFGGLCGLFCTVCALVACVACFALCVLWWPVWPILHCVCFGGLCGFFALCVPCWLFFGLCEMACAASSVACAAFFAVCACFVVWPFALCVLVLWPAWRALCVRVIAYVPCCCV